MGGPSDFNDANPVDAEHVYLQMSKNFPPDAIDWVKRAKWTGPQWVPWDRVDTDDRDKWAASRQPGKVNEFVRQIKAHGGHVAPSILAQEPNSHRAFIVDGHHRALAREKLKQKVLGYVGNIDPRDRERAEQTHSKQFHQGADPENKRQKVSKESVDYRDGSDTRRCGNCVMFHAGTCDLVKGTIEPGMTCDEWEAIPAAKSAETPYLSAHHAPIGHEGLWHSKKPPLQIPAYIQNVRNALMRAGHDEDSAHAMAVGAIERWARGEGAWGHHGHVTPEVRAAAQSALAEWEKLRANHP